MADHANEDVVDALAATLFNADHPDRLWTDPSANRLGVASAHERATYRGFATAQLTNERTIAEPTEETAAIAADVVALGGSRDTTRSAKRA